jgi:hypothetical protein
MRPVGFDLSDQVRTFASKTQEVEMWESRVAPLTGVLFGVLLLASFAVDPNTDFMPPPDAVVNHVSNSPGAVMASGYLRALAAAALIWFAGSLYRSLHENDDDQGRLSTLGVAGAGLAAALTAVGAVATVAAAERVWVAGSIDPGSATTLLDLAGIATGNGAPIGFALMIGAAGIVWLRTERMPRWAAWTSVVLAVALLSPYAWVVLAVVLLWVPAVGVAIYREDTTKHVPPVSVR